MTYDEARKTMLLIAEAFEADAVFNSDLIRVVDPGKVVAAIRALIAGPSEPLSSRPTSYEEAISRLRLQFHKPRLTEKLWISADDARALLAGLVE